MIFLRKLALSLCAASLVCIASPLLAGSKTAMPMKKKYVDAKSLRITSKGIILREHGENIRINGVHADKNGKLFVYKVKNSKNVAISKGYCEDHGWYIPYPIEGPNNCRGCKERDKREKRDRNDKRGQD